MNQALALRWSKACSDEGLMLETSAKHHTPQAKNIPYQPLLIKPIFSVLAHAEKVFFKTSLPVFNSELLQPGLLLPTSNSQYNIAYLNYTEIFFSLEKGAPSVLYRDI